MDNETWQHIVASLVDAKRCLGDAFQALESTDGSAPGVEQAMTAALAAIDAVYAAEVTNALNQDVASPAEVQEFWEEHGQLPGFAVGS